MYESYFEENLKEIKFSIHLTNTPLCHTNASFFYLLCSVLQILNSLNFVCIICCAFLYCKKANFLPGYLDFLFLTCSWNILFSISHNLWIWANIYSSLWALKVRELSTLLGILPQALGVAWGIYHRKGYIEFYIIEYFFMLISYWGW